MGWRSREGTAGLQCFWRGLMSTPHTRFYLDCVLSEGGLKGKTHGGYGLPPSNPLLDGAVNI